MQAPRGALAPKRYPSAVKTVFIEHTAAVGLNALTLGIQPDLSGPDAIICHRYFPLIYNLQPAIRPSNE